MGSSTFSGTSRLFAKAGPVSAVSAARSSTTRKRRPGIPGSRVYRPAAGYRAGASCPTMGSARDPSAASAAPDGISRRASMAGTEPGALKSLVDVERGIISREIIVSDEIYRQELERIFVRTWLFLGHESQIPKPGDYLTSSMGEESVILCRDRAGRI